MQRAWLAYGPVSLIQTLYLSFCDNLLNCQRILVKFCRNVCYCAYICIKQCQMLKYYASKIFQTHAIFGACLLLCVVLSWFNLQKLPPEACWALPWNVQRVKIWTVFSKYSKHRSSIARDSRRLHINFAKSFIKNTADLNERKCIVIPREFL